jgi:hypothetical protein
MPALFCGELPLEEFGEMLFVHFHTTYFIVNKWKTLAPVILLFFHSGLKPCTCMECSSEKDHNTTRVLGL